MESSMVVQLCFAAYLVESSKCVHEVNRTEKPRLKIEKPVIICVRWCEERRPNAESAPLMHYVVSMQTIECSPPSLPIKTKPPYSEAFPFTVFAPKY